ncbi:hypothetical protein KIPB_012342, partial [Kipferlia bialata]
GDEDEGDKAQGEKGAEPDMVSLSACGVAPGQELVILYKGGRARLLLDTLKEGDDMVLLRKPDELEALIAATVLPTGAEGEGETDTRESSDAKVETEVELAPVGGDDAMMDFDVEEEGESAVWDHFC